MISEKLEQAGIQRPGLSGIVTDVRWIVRHQFSERLPVADRFAHTNYHSDSSQFVLLATELSPSVDEF